MADLVKIRNEIIDKTYRDVLPGRFRSSEATVQMLTIGQHESLFEHRVQVGGPAHGFWQFEKGGGVRGVLEHKITRPYALAACSIRNTLPTADAVYARIVDDDLLACAFARLLLYSDPKPLPVIGQASDAFDYYLRTWRPGAYSRGSASQREALWVKWKRFYALSMVALA